MIAYDYDCDLAPICTGPAPFDPDTLPCCDEHEEEWTREKAKAVWLTRQGEGFVYWLANTIGVAPLDMARFLVGGASLTYPARVRIRGVLG